MSGIWSMPHQDVQSLMYLANKYKTDKGDSFGARNNYVPTYNRYLSWIQLDVKKVLEIGIHGGASLRMWRDYFPNATVYGIDILEKTMFHEDRIVCKKRDQGNLAHLDEVGGWGPYDLIIDDGSHQPNHQILGVEYLWKYLAPKGIYVIEDICTSYDGEHCAIGGGVDSVMLEWINDLQLSMAQPKKGLVRVGDREVAVAAAKSFGYQLTEFQETIEFIHFYKNIIFFGKM